MRSPQELSFRIWQQVANAAMFVAKPSLQGVTGPPVWPLEAPQDPELEPLAEQIMQHRFPILGLTIETGPEIEWRRDYVSGKSSGTDYFRFIPYLDFERVGDHKVIWELSRHQHLVLLAQAFLASGREDYMDEIVRQLASWWRQNPFLRGINWASALEVAFRALSWIWIDHLVGDRLPAEMRARLWSELYRHGLYLEHNLSTYFSPNTHLLGEGVALHALGVAYPGWKAATRWRQLGARIVAEQLRAQVKDDGSHFEQSTYYHVYALDLFLLHYVLAGRPFGFESALCAMGRYLAAIMGPARVLPFFGDDDGGRLFHPYGACDQFGRTTLANCAALFPDEDFTFADEARLFEQSGVAAIARGDLHLVADAGPFGSGGAGHSHSDTLSLTVRKGDREILIDPGTYTYMAGREWRDRFRGSAAHNTLRINGLDQADPINAFRWENKPTVKVRQWDAAAEHVFLDAECRSRGFVHRRRLYLYRSDFLVILDDVDGPEGEHRIEQFWNVPPGGSECFLSSAPGVTETGWRSETFGVKTESPVLRVTMEGALPVRLAAAVVFQPASKIEIQEGPSVLLHAGTPLRIAFRDSGVPVVSAV